MCVRSQKNEDLFNGLKAILKMCIYVAIYIAVGDIFSHRFKCPQTKYIRPDLRMGDQ